MMVNSSVSGHLQEAHVGILGDGVNQNEPVIFGEIFDGQIFVE